MKIKLRDLAKAMAKSDVHQGYVDIKLGKVIIMQDDMAEADTLDHIFDIEDDWQHYIPLPNVIDNEAHAIMLGFIEKQARADIKDRLLAALNSTGAAIKFQQQVRHLLLKSAWESYQQEYFMATARDWCEENDLEYEED